MTIATAYQYIVLDEEVVAQVADANTKVVEVVLLSRASGQSPELLSRDVPHLSPAQIHSALAYYWDHKDQLDDEIRRREEGVERIREDLGQPPVVARLLERRRT